MSSFKRFVDIAKSEVGALRDRALGRNLEDYTDEELSAEIERRRLQREQREDADAQRAAEEGRRARAQADRPAAARPRSSAPPPDVRSPVGKTLAQFYANLEVPLDADLETVKRSYRKLMRRYHPDRHADDPTKHKAATELAQSLTRAYMEIKKHLEERR